MQYIKKNKENSKSKYVRDPREKTIFYRCAIFYLFALYVMPQYFGIPNPLFDLTIVRIAIIILLVFIVFDYTRLREFMDCIVQDRMSLILLPYIIVLLYTMILRRDINAFLNPFIEFLEMYLLIYVIKDAIGVDKTIKTLQYFIYFLVILGFVEIVMKESPFAYLETIKHIYTGRYIRGGHYRIMSSCIHSIGYGLLLVSAMPLAGYDVESKTFNIFRRPLLLLGIIVNIFSTGSRSSLGIMFAEVFLMFILSDRKYQRMNLLIVITSLTIFFIAVFGLQKTSFGQYILLQITSVIDSIFHTQLAAKYGADSTQLHQSAAYRDLLKQIFHVDWLNPILGIGRKRAFKSNVNGLVVESIDNFYIAEYIRYAYPGMFAYIFFLGYMGVRMIKDFIKTRSALLRVLIIGAICYCIHLYIADSLQTLKYLYVLFALYICCEKVEYVPEAPSKYFRKRVFGYARK
ncbi:hypothetical protein [Butyrivibrio sp. VCD2006]|uniref:hypothetical protein n=1 Tax=Butyrivibrio sp. VCD2006 TaxID=1280664 RepID=UPI0003FAAF1E|nr:hypothetical protein [Butyrivibrio sp. VCD2006]